MMSLLASQCVDDTLTKTGNARLARASSRLYKATRIVLPRAHLSGDCVIGEPPDFSLFALQVPAAEKAPVSLNRRAGLLEASDETLVGASCII